MLLMKTTEKMKWFLKPYELKQPLVTVGTIWRQVLLPDLNSRRKVEWTRHYLTNKICVQTVT